MDFKILTINVFRKKMKSWIIPPTGGIRTEIYRKESNGNSRTKNNAVLKLRIQCNSRLGFPGGSVVKNTPANASSRHKFDPWVWKISWGRKWQPTPTFLPGKSHGQRSLAGYSPWGHKE